MWESCGWVVAPAVVCDRDHFTYYIGDRAIDALPPPYYGRVTLDLRSKYCDQLVSERVRTDGEAHIILPRKGPEATSGRARVIQASWPLPGTITLDSSAGLLAG
jgi:hypothetical protein